MRIGPAIVALALVSCAATNGAEPVVDVARPVGQSDLRFVPAAPWSLPTPSMPPAAIPSQPVVHAAQRPPETIPPGPATGPAPHGLPAKLSLADFEGMALSTNPVLSRAAARVEAARGSWEQVGLPPNLTTGYTAAEIGDEGRGGQQGGFIGQEVVTGGKLRLNRAVASAEIAMAQQQLAAERFRVLNDVRIAFYTALIVERRIQIASQLVGIGQRSVEVVNQFVEREEASRVDLLQARVESNSARILLENARNDYQAAWRRLTAVVGVPQLHPAPLEGDLQAGLCELSFDGAMHQLLAASPELAAAQSNVARAGQALLRARAEPYPNIDMLASAQHDNATGSDIAAVQFGFPVPLLNRNQGGIRRARGELAAAESNVRRVELELQHRLASVFRRYANARQQVEIYTREILPDAQASLDLVTNGYRAGEFGYLLLLTAQRTFFQTNLAYLDSLLELRLATIEIEGLLLTGSLEDRSAVR